MEITLWAYFLPALATATMHPSSIKINKRLSIPYGIGVSVFEVLKFVL
jgi:hypothetical protein